MGRLLILTAAMVLLAAAFSGTAWANFGGEGRSSTGDSLDLRLNRSMQADGLRLSGVMPGSDGQGVYRLQNAGNQEGSLSVHIPAVVNVAAVTRSTGSGQAGEHADGRGDLGGKLLVAPFIDVDANGAWSGGDIGLDADGSTHTDSLPRFHPLDSFSTMTWQSITRMAPGSEVTLIMLWRIPPEVGNEIQGDSVRFDVEFTLAQAW